jgi:type IV secretion system protein VirB4
LLADWLPWAGLVAPGVVLNKDGSFQRTARFRGPDLDSATQGELIATSARLNNALRRLGSGWALFIEAERRRPRTIRTPTFPNRCPGWWTKNAALPSRNRATTSRAAIT